MKRALFLLVCLFFLGLIVNLWLDRFLAQHTRPGSPAAPMTNWAKPAPAASSKQGHP